jgi:hypothetical protein
VNELRYRWRGSAYCYWYLVSYAISCPKFENNMFFQTGALILSDRIRSCSSMAKLSVLRCRIGSVLMAAAAVLAICLPTCADTPPAVPVDGAAAPAAPSSNSPLSGQIGNWEHQFFTHRYTDETIEARLKRLEQLVFGAVQRGTPDQRVAKLQSSLNQPSDGPAVPAGVAEYVTTPKAPAAQEPSSALPSVVSEAGAQVPSGTPTTPLSVSLANPNAKYNIDENPVRPVEMKVTKDNFVTALKPDRVIQNLNEAIRDNPKDPELEYQRAKAYIQQERLDKALSDLSDAIMFQPNRSDFYLARAWVYHLQGNSVLADIDLKQARFVDPKFPEKVDWGQ